MNSTMTPEMTEAIILSGKIRDIQNKISQSRAEGVTMQTYVGMMQLCVERLGELGEETKHIYQRNLGVLEMYKGRMKDV